MRKRIVDVSYFAKDDECNEKAYSLRKYIIASTYRISVLILQWSLRLTRAPIAFSSGFGIMAVLYRV